MIVEEFYLQGEQEKRLGIPISPSMDRQTTSQAKISIQFNDLIARPYFEALGDILDPMECFVDLLKTNRVEWIAMMEMSKEVKFSEEDDDAEISPKKVPSLGRQGRRMSTAAGTVHIPQMVMSRRLPVPTKRHSFCALTPKEDEAELMSSLTRHSYQEDTMSFTPDGSSSSCK
jgi:hypothetical protein